MLLICSQLSSNSQRNIANYRAFFGIIALVVVITSSVFLTNSFCENTFDQFRWAVFALGGSSCIDIVYLLARPKETKLSKISQLKPPSLQEKDIIDCSDADLSAKLRNAIQYEPENVGKLLSWSRTNSSITKPVLPWWAYHYPKISLNLLLKNTRESERRAFLESINEDQIRRYAPIEGCEEAISQWRQAWCSINKDTSNSSFSNLK